MQVIIGVLIASTLCAWRPPLVQTGGAKGIQGAQASLLQSEDHSHCVCDYHEEVTEKTKYSRTFLRVIGSGFGLWGSTKKCKKVYSRKWVYDYTGPGYPPSSTSTGQSSLSGSTDRSQAGLAFVVIGQPNQWSFRWMNAESTCAGDLHRPDFDSLPEMLSFVALDGTSFNVPFQPVTGTLTYFLGTAFDPSEYDPVYVNTDLWTGIKGTLPKSAFIKPTLTVSIGADPGTPVAGMMNLANPDAKTLALELDSSFAGLQYSVLVSSTYQDEGALGVIDGVTVPVVLDATTAYFGATYPGLSGVTDSLGDANINFPLLTDPSLHGLDLSIAVVVHDSTTGAVVKASTYVGLTLRDLTLCN